MIIVNPNAGLCNRMRVINSCLHLARMNKVPQVQVVWEQNSLLNASFSDIFQPVVNVKLIKRSRRLDYFRYYQNAIGGVTSKQKIGKQLYWPFVHCYKYYDDVKISSLRFDDSYWNDGHKKVIFNTCEDFYLYSDDTNYYHLFKPVESIQQTINYIIQKFNHHTIGIHIRRTDNLVSSEISKTDLFIQEIDQLLNTDPNIRFYLSTDDFQVEDDLKKRYDQSIITLVNKDLSRSSKKGIEDAVTDLYALSSTKLILGSYWSSFSAVASWIKGIPLKIVK